mgnify:CR=1 FL=1
MGEDLLRRALLDDAASVHDDHIVCHFGDDAEVVRDEHDRGIDLILQIAQKVEDLRLDRHVERRGGLVGDHPPRPAGQPQGGHQPLVHAAAHLEGILVQDALRLLEAEAAEQLGGLGLRLPPLPAPVGGDGLGELAAELHHRVQGGAGGSGGIGPMAAPRSLRSRRRGME